LGKHQKRRKGCALERAGEKSKARVERHSGGCLWGGSEPETSWRWKGDGKKTTQTHLRTRGKFCWKRKKKVRAEAWIGRFELLTEKGTEQKKERVRADKRGGDMCGDFIRVQKGEHGTRR